eukprot:10805797-Lingulodinium_polyedra.AAC.1
MVAASCCLLASSAATAKVTASCCARAIAIANRSCAAPLTRTEPGPKAPTSACPRSLNDRGGCAA